jgi:hypothetical protein
MVHTSGFGCRLRTRYTAVMVGFLRYLRIAFSATCLIACVLLIVLWVRSYWWQDTLYVNYAGRDTPNYSGTKSVNLTSAQGRIAVFNKPMRWAPRISTNHSKISDTFQPLDYTDDVGNAPSAIWFRVMRWSKPSHTSVEFPNWFLALCFSALAMAPWLRWRFSLRTLLIATTLVAVVLGLIVWLRELSATSGATSLFCSRAN